MANLSCARCGTEALPEYKFCLKCGAPLAGAGDAGAGAAATKARLILIKGEGGDTASYTLGGR
ncbi:MAG: zinc-ribbon domain-containing protein, partial [Deltaproteobacteria bacterium]|nr:zinc-ribbon domain-containing protein [Deltaproteobacteria bacterium]